MQTKERTVTDKKTGKAKVVNGSSPIRESVVVCKQDTTIDQLRKYCDRCHDRWGITALQIFIHQDEGHYGIPGDNSTWKPNSHAHIVWDWMNHETGKSCKLGKVDKSLMQDMVAEFSGLDQGFIKLNFFTPSEAAEKEWNDMKGVWGMGNASVSGDAPPSN